MLSPKSDWERLFADKIDNSEIENMIETVRSTRNDIAHCKFFYKEQYNTFNKVVTDLNHLILKAIQLTEEKDFVHKQAESFWIALAGITDTLVQFQKYIKDSISSSLKSLGKMLSNIDFSRLATIEEDELNDENDEEDNEESPT